jgi:hypothetical protein
MLTRLRSDARRVKYKERISASSDSGGEKVLRKLSITLTAAATALILGVSAWGQGTPAPKEKKWKDRQEYDLYDSIAKAQDPAKQLELLNQWKAKYPDSDFKDDRHQFFIAAYRKANKGTELFQYCKDVVASDPKDMSCMYWINVIAVEVPNPAADMIDTAEKAANSMLANLDATFTPDKKPKEMKDEDWQKQRTAIEAIGHKTLGWAAMNRKNNEVAEQEFIKSLKADPNQGLVSSWLGTVMLAQRKPEKQVPALFHIARAANYTGPGEAPAQVRQSLDAYLTRVYKGFHGSEEGLPELRAMAKKDALPPADFKIKSQVELESENEAQAKQQNPMRYLWRNIKKELSEKGDPYFNEHLKDANLPGGVEGVQKFKGFLISMKPATNPKELVVGITDATTPEVTLKLDTPLKGKADPGTELSFTGVATAFTKDPFNLSFDVEKANLEGWPASAAPAPAPKKTAPVKKATPKK